MFDLQRTSKSKREEIRRKKVVAAIKGCQDKLDKKTGQQTDSFYEGFQEACRWVLKEVI